MLSKGSTFTKFAAAVQYARGNRVCEAWPFAEFQPIPDKELRSRHKYQESVLGLGKPTSYDYYCYRHVDGACDQGPGPGCRARDTPMLTNVFHENSSNYAATWYTLFLAVALAVAVMCYQLFTRKTRNRP